MKFIIENVPNSDNKKYIFALGYKEAEILHAALVNAYKWTPRTISTIQTSCRIQNMKKCVERAMHQIKKSKSEIEESW